MDPEDDFGTRVAAAIVSLSRPKASIERLRELHVQSYSNIGFSEEFPLLFQDLRQYFDGDATLYEASFEAPLVPYVKDSGKSGCRFLCTQDGRFLVKSLLSDEVDVVRSMLGKYRQHATRKNVNTLLTQIYGLYALNDEHFYVMRNLLPSGVNPADCDHVFDVKGSDRSAKSEAFVKHERDFEKWGKFSLGPAQAAAFRTALTSDVQFLEQFNVMDYSLYLAVQSVPPERFRPRPPTQDSFRSVNGGCYATDENDEPLPVIFYMGVIDFLMPYTNLKMAERIVKSAVGSSVQSPEVYRERLLKFVDAHIHRAKAEKRTPPDAASAVPVADAASSTAPTAAPSNGNTTPSGRRRRRHRRHDSSQETSNSFFDSASPVENAGEGGSAHRHHRHRRRHSSSRPRSPAHERPREQRPQSTAAPSSSSCSQDGAEASNRSKHLSFPNLAAKASPVQSGTRFSVAYTVSSPTIDSAAKRRGTKHAPSAQPCGSSAGEYEYAYNSYSSEGNDRTEKRAKATALAGARASGSGRPRANAGETKEHVASTHGASGGGAKRERKKNHASMSFSSSDDAEDGGKDAQRNQDAGADLEAARDVRHSPRRSKTRRHQPTSSDGAHNNDATRAGGEAAPQRKRGERKEACGDDSSPWETDAESQQVSRASTTPRPAAPVVAGDDPTSSPAPFVSLTEEAAQRDREARVQRMRALRIKRAAEQAATGRRGGARPHGMQSMTLSPDKVKQAAAAADAPSTTAEASSTTTEAAPTTTATTTQPATTESTTALTTNAPEFTIGAGTVPMTETVAGDLSGRPAVPSAASGDRDAADANPDNDAHGGSNSPQPQTEESPARAETPSEAAPQTETESRAGSSVEVVPEPASGTGAAAEGGVSDSTITVPVDTAPPMAPHGPVAAGSTFAMDTATVAVVRSPMRDGSAATSALTAELSTAPTSAGQPSPMPSVGDNHDETVALGAVDELAAEGATRARATSMDSWDSVSSPPRGSTSASTSHASPARSGAATSAASDDMSWAGDVPDSAPRSPPSTCSWSEAGDDPDPSRPRGVRFREVVDTRSASLDQDERASLYGDSGRSAHVFSLGLDDAGAYSASSETLSDDGTLCDSKAEAHERDRVMANVFEDAAVSHEEEDTADGFYSCDDE